MCLKCQGAFGTQFKSRPANKVRPEESGLKDKWSIAEEQGSEGAGVGPSTVTVRKLGVSWVDTWKVLADAQVLALSPVGRISFLPHQPGPPQPQSFVYLALAFAYCQLREDTGPALNHPVLVVDLASPLVTRPYGYSFFIHSGIYQDSRAPVFLTLALDYCFSAFSCSSSLLSFSLSVSQQALLVV